MNSSDDSMQGTEVDQSTRSALASSEQEATAAGPVGVVGGAATTALALVLRQASAFFISIVIARALGTSGKGALALLGQYAGIVALVCGLGFEAANAYFVGRKGKTAEQAVADSFALVGVSALLAAPALWSFMSFVVPATRDVNPVALALSAVSAPLILATSTLTGILTGLGRVSKQAMATIAGTAVSTVLVIGFWALGALSLTTAMLSTTLGLVINVTAGVYFAGVRRLVAPSLARMKDEVGYSLRSYVQNVAGYLELRQDVLLLGFMSTAGAIGIYSTGVSFAELLYFVPQAIVAALTAHVMSVEEESGIEMTGLVTRLLVAFSFVSALLLAAVVRPVIAIAFGDAFVDATYVYLLLVPGVLSWAVGSQLQAYLATRGRLFPLLGLGALVLNLVLNLILIPRFGIFGAAVATSVSYSAGNAYVAGVYLRETRRSVVQTLVLRRSDLDLVVIAAKSRLGRRR